MSKTSTLSLGLTVTGDGVNDSYAPPPVTNSAAPYGGQVSLALAAGFNTITKPAGAVGCVITPPATSTNAKTLKGLTGDTGIGIATASPTVLAATATFGITSAGIETVLLYWY